MTRTELFLAAGLALLFLLQLLQMGRLRLVLGTFRRLTRGASEENLEKALARLLEGMEAVRAEVVRLRGDHQALTQLNRRALQRVGMVRFNAYADTGGDQSFALALTDEDGNGTVLNGLFHRSECRVYAKPVTRWESTYPLTDEEQEALRKARG